MPSFLPATAMTCPGGPVHITPRANTQTQPVVNTQDHRREEKRRTTDENLDLVAEVCRRYMRLDEFAADVARRAGPALRGLVERVNDAQGVRVRALERTELLAQEDVRLRDVRVEQREARAVRGVGQRMVEQLVERGDAGAATDQRDLLEFVLYYLSDTDNCRHPQPISPEKRR